jgi:hypothetical protein
VDCRFAEKETRQLNRFGLILLASLVLIAATRIPLAPGQLFSFDDVNFAYAMGDFDIANSQPQPPGYPLFVLETRVLSCLRFKRAESNFLALSILGSAAALVSLAYFGNRILGRDSGLIAAALLLFHHSFWYAGLTSAIRTQLALISVVVAGLCFRAWNGERRWIYGSAIALGVCSGIRPEMGPLLLPLWLASVFRATRNARAWLSASALLTATVLAWLAPAVLASGGPKNYVLLTWHYLTEQATLTSGVFGAQDERWYGTIVWLMVWSMSTILALPAAAILAWRGGSGFGLTRSQIGFLLLWLLPALLSAILVHVADPGQTLAIVPIVCLVGGYLIGRAMDTLSKRIPELQATLFAGVPLTFALSTLVLHPRWVLTSVPVVCIAAGLLLKRLSAGGAGRRMHSLLFLLSPALFLNLLIFFQPVWYYRGTQTGFERLFDDLHSGLSFTSLAQIRATVWVDHNTLVEIGRLSSEQAGNSVVIWANGLTAWRKINYYFPKLPVVVLENKTLQNGSRPIATTRRGSSLERIQSWPDLRIKFAPGTRLIWVLNPNAPFYSALHRALPLQPVPGFDHMFSTDLEGHGEAQIGSYMVIW